MMLSKEEIISQARDNKDYTGVYFLVKKNEIIYIGSSLRIGKRITAHYSQLNFDYYSFVEIDTKNLDILRTSEAEYIMEYKPRYNKSIPSNNLYISINSGLPRVISIISNRHKVKLLKENGFKIFKYDNKFGNLSNRIIWYIHKKEKKDVTLFLIRNFEKLEKMQKDYNNLKKEVKTAEQHS